MKEGACWGACSYGPSSLPGLEEKKKKPLVTLAVTTFPGATPLMFQVWLPQVEEGGASERRSGVTFRCQPGTLCRLRDAPRRTALVISVGGGFRGGLRPEGEDFLAIEPWSQSSFYSQTVGHAELGFQDG
ncbi:hypothetical protein EYF80_056896 [Liparis tanakae]|uniref:Uncharacterized protein n=1 Tax=Liparis tanakae TaxID=230148 RepID=A0A4Z2EVU8_9TELE|nr:hypothetical protein EYF80_056896 [Liparis tanakae]